MAQIIPQPIDFIDLKAQQQLILPAVRDRIQRVLAHGQYIMGPEVTELEHCLAAYVGVQQVIACSSGTDALLMALMAYGVGPGDAIFTTPFTFIATAEAVQLLGATPVFVDVEARTFNLDPEALEEALANLGKRRHTARLRPKGIMPVDIFGQPADYDRINRLARRYGLFVLEDAAQSFGATYKGKRAGALAQVAATSFFPAKPLGCYGDGGAIFTDDDHLAEVLRSMRNHGQGDHKYEHVRVGINGRLDTLQAAILLAKLEIFDEEIIRRQEVARRYNEALHQAVEIPYLAPDCTSVWAQYSVRSDQRAILRDKLHAAGIPTAVYYPIPLHRQSVFAYLGHELGDFPITERLADRIFSLPMSPYVLPEDQDTIINIILNINQEI